MPPRLLAQEAAIAPLPSISELAASPWAWAALLGGLGVWLMLPRGGRAGWWPGLVLCAGALVLRGAALPRIDDLLVQICFWIVGATAAVSAVATITSRSPVYSAIWFAVTLLSVGGLFLLNGAQFLAVATVTVYAGAILVTFLFVLMLAQPEGLTPFDRISWGRYGAACGAISGTLLLPVLLGTALGQARDPVAQALPEVVDHAGKRLIADEQLLAVRYEGPRVHVTLKGEASLLAEEQLAQLLQRPVMFTYAEAAPETAAGDVLHPEHMAHFGGELLSKHLVALEVAGTLLLAALVGAISIAVAGRDPEMPLAASTNGRPQGARHG